MECIWTPQKEENGVPNAYFYDFATHYGILYNNEWVCWRILQRDSQKEGVIREVLEKMPEDWTPQNAFTIEPMYISSWSDTKIRLPSFQLQLQPLLQPSPQPLRQPPEQSPEQPPQPLQQSPRPSQRSHRQQKKQHPRVSHQPQLQGQPLLQQGPLELEKQQSSFHPESSQTPESPKKFSESHKSNRTKSGAQLSSSTSNHHARRQQQHQSQQAQLPSLLSLTKNTEAQWTPLVSLAQHQAPSGPAPSKQKTSSPPRYSKESSQSVPSSQHPSDQQTYSRAPPKRYPHAQGKQRKAQRQTNLVSQAQ